MKQLLTCSPYSLVCWAPALLWFIPAVAAGPKRALAPATVVAAKTLVVSVADSLTAAAHPILLKGTVLLRTGQPCAGASVYVAGAPRQLVITNAQGVFTLPMSTGATAVLYIDYFGEGTSRVKVVLPVTEPLRITLGQ